MKLSHLLFVGISLVASLFLFACSPSKGTGKYKIAVTIAPTETLIKEILDSLSLAKIELKVLLPDGSIPENYEPSIETVSFLERCDAWYYVGDLGFESQWIKTVKELNPQIKLIRLDEGLKHLTTEHHHHHGEEAHSHISDPHYWTSVQGMRVMYRNIAKALEELFPQHIDTARLDSISDKLQEQVAKISSYNVTRRELGAQTAFVVYHPALTYLADECGFEQWVIEDEGKEPTPQHMAELSRKWLPHPEADNPTPQGVTELNLLLGKNPKVIVLREYHTITEALATTYKLHLALDKDGVFVFDAFSPNVWKDLERILSIANDLPKV